MSDPTPPIATATLQRAGALCCVLAGALRIPSAFIDGDDPGPALEALYYVIDISLLFGLITLFTVDPSSRRRPGVAGFVLAATSTGFLIGPEPQDAAVDHYAIGAAAVAIGLALLAVAWSRSTLWPRWTRWALIAVPVLGALGDAGAPVAGVLFGVALLRLGLAVRRAPIPVAA